MTTIPADRSLAHIGILAHSADGAALCFVEMCREAARLLGAHDHPEITLSILPMAPALPLWQSMDVAALNDMFRRTAGNLAAAGCDFFVCPDNTAHIALEAAASPLPLPGLHIGEEVARSAKQRGLQRIALLGTRWTMEGPVYPAAFARNGIAMSVPRAEERELIDQIIFDELCQGVVSGAARTTFLEIMSRMEAEGCDAAALCCTEIPLLIRPGDTDMPLLDSTRLLAHAAVAVALGSAPMPTWRGGRI